MWTGRSQGPVRKRFCVFGLQEKPEPSQAPPPLTRCFCPLVLLREEVAQLQEEVHLLRQMKELLAKDLEESQGGKCSEVLSATELRVQLVQKEQELARAKEALQGE